MDVVINNAAMDTLSADIEVVAAEISEIPHPDITTVVAAFMPDSPMVDASAAATETISGSLTVVSGQGIDGFGRPCDS